MYFRAMIPKAQANQNQVSQRKTLLKEYIFKPSGLLSDLMQVSFNTPPTPPQSVNPGRAGCVGQRTDTP